MEPHTARRLCTETDIDGRLVTGMMCDSVRNNDIVFNYPSDPDRWEDGWLDVCAVTGSGELCYTDVKPLIWGPGTIFLTLRR